MKKVHLNFLSLLPIFLVLGIFFMSSYTVEDSPQISTERTGLILEKGYLLPLEISNQSAEDVENHMMEMSSEAEMTYINNHIVGQYLLHFGKADYITNNLSEKANLSEADLSGILTDTELDEVKSKLLKSSSEVKQECVKNYRWDTCCWRDHNGVCVAAWCGNGCWPPNCGC